MVVSAIVQGSIGLLFYLAVQRNMQKVDRLQERLNNMEQKKLADIEENARRLETRIDDRERDAAGKRKKIYEEMVDIRTHFVHVKACEKMHTRMAEQFERFSGSVIDLAKIQDRMEVLTKQLDHLGEQVVALGRDLSHMEGQHSE